MPTAKDLAARLGRGHKPKVTTRQSSEDALTDTVLVDGVPVGHVRGPFQGSRGRFYDWTLFPEGRSAMHPFGRSGMSGRTKSRSIAVSSVARADKVKG